MATEFDPRLISKNNPFGEVLAGPNTEVSTKRQFALDALDRAIACILEMKASRENSLAITKIEEAQMWLNKGGK